jgi:hypothetical protein
MGESYYINSAKINHLTKNIHYAPNFSIFKIQKFFKIKNYPLVFDFNTYNNLTVAKENR